MFVQGSEMSAPQDVLNKLKGGDRRSIGRSDEVVIEVLDDPDLFENLFKGLWDEDPVVRMRASDAVEKISARKPEWIQPFKLNLIQLAGQIEQQEVRWHIAQILPRLELEHNEQAAVVEILFRYLDDKSKIVKTFCMQALADFAEKDSGLRPRVITLLAKLTRTGSPAMKSRGKKLLEKLENKMSD
jgi:hypothetical protein